MIKLAKKKLTSLFLPERNAKKPLKRSMSGYETEQFVLKADGSLDHSDILYKKAKASGINAETECAKSMIELSCFPAKRLRTTSQSMIDNHIELHKVAEKNNLLLFPFGTYFGTNQPIFRNKIHYNMKKKILGEKRFKYAGVCTGVHQHYALPKGVFDKKTKSIKELKNSKINKTLIDSFNLITAADPVLTTLTQSSPFIDGKRMGKDARVIVYRGGSFLDFKNGLYAQHRLFGALSHYKSTVKDLTSTQKRRYEKWEQLVKKAGYDAEKYIKKEKMLAYNWTPVKINPHGTLEYRGYDMNYMSIILGTSTLLKFALRTVQQNFMMVVPLDIDVKEAFKVENNMIFIPPFSVVTKLQKKAAYYGLDDDEVYAYVKSFYNFARKVTNENYLPLLEPIKEIIESRKTQSDRIIEYFKRKGHKDEIPKSAVKEAAIKFSEEFRKDLIKTKEKIDSIEN